MCLETLREGGFRRIGCWNTVPEAGLMALDGVTPKEAGVYAHVVDGVVCYVGSAQRGLSKRMRHYARTMTMRTAYRIRQEVLAALQKGSVVEVYMLVFGDALLSFQGLPVDLVAGVEEGLIRSLRPAWNRRGLGGDM